MPLTPAEQNELDQLEYEQLVADQSKAGERPGPLSRTGSSKLEGRPQKPKAGLAADLLLEAGIPMGAQALTAEGAPLGITSAVGAGASALGNLLAQARRMVAGEQNDFSFGQLGQATATGAIPFAGPAKNAERVARPIVRAAVEAGKVGAKMAAVGYAGEAIKMEIDEGRMPTLGEAAMSTAVPAVLGGAGSLIGSAAKSIATKGRRVAENAADYSSIGARPTPGMLLPEELATTEARIAKKNPTGPVADNIDQVYSSLKEGIQGVAPNPQEGAQIFNQASPLLGAVASTEQELAKLNEAAVAANEKAKAAYAQLGEARASQDETAKIMAREQADILSAEAFDKNLKSALDNAREIAVGRTTGGANGIDPATARDLMVEQVAKPARAAFEERSAQLYSGVDNMHPGFSAKPVLDYAENLAAQVTGGLPKKLESTINLVRENLGGENVSLQAMRNARAEILRKVRLNEFGSDSEERLIKGVASEITRQIDSQAVGALGEEAGDALKVANKFYKETIPLFDEIGVDALFASKPSDEYVRKMVNGIKQAGINSDEYKNIQNLIVGITKGGGEGALSPELQQNLGELASVAKGHVNDVIKKSVIFDASRINPSSPNGELMVDGEELLKSLRQMGRVPGTLEQIGLGSPKQVAELETLFKKYPDASKLSGSEWEQLFSSGAFRAETLGGGYSKVELSSKLGDMMAASQSDNLLLKAANLKAAGKTAKAETLFNDALKTVEDVGGNVAEVRSRYESLLKDPVAIAFNNPNLGDSDFNAFARSLFDPKANKVTNSDVAELASALRSSPSPDNKALLLRLQERYIADRVASYHSTPASSQALDRPNASGIAEFFNPANPGDASNEIERAKSLLSPEQMTALSAFSKTAKAVARYEKLGTTPVTPGSYDIPVVGQVRRGLDAIADLYREGKYEIAAKLLADPAKFSRIAIKVGDAGASAGSGAAQAGAVGAGRTITNRQSP